MSLIVRSPKIGCVMRSLSIRVKEALKIGWNVRKPRNLILLPRFHQQIMLVHVL
jgi:hypothetical protein